MFDQWLSCRNILCVRLDQIGDMLMTTPAIRAIKQSIPSCRVTVLTSSICQTIVPVVPCIDDSIAYDAPWMKASFTKNSSSDHAIIEVLAQGHFDGAVIFNVFSQNPLPAAYLCYLAGIPLRLGFCRENPYQLLTHWIKEAEATQAFRHEVKRQLDLVSAIGCFNRDPKLEIVIPQIDRDYLNSLLRVRFQWDGLKPLIVVHPGSSASSRRYSPDKFAQAIDLLSRKTNGLFLLTGSDKERELVEDVMAAMRTRAFSLAGELSLPQLGALIGKARVLITNNTAPAHMAAALGTPVVDLYALTNPQHTPWRVMQRVLNHDVPCKYCYKSICPHGHQDCLNKVSPYEVAMAALELIEEPLCTH